MRLTDEWSEGWEEAMSLVIPITGHPQYELDLKWRSSRAKTDTDLNSVDDQDVEPPDGT